MISDIGEVKLCGNRYIGTACFFGIFSRSIDANSASSSDIEKPASLRWTVLSQRVDHIIEWIECTLEDVQFSGDYMEFSCVLHRWTSQNINFLEISVEKNQHTKSAMSS
jgi:hypothetical protein